MMKAYCFKFYCSYIKAKLNAGLSDNEKIVAECKTLANSNPE